MKKVSLFAAIVIAAFTFSCGNAEKTAETPVTTETTVTETPVAETPVATETPVAETPVATETPVTTETPAAK